MVDKELIDQVVEVNRKSDHIIFIKLVVGSKVCLTVSVYAPKLA